ncbi:MAG: GlsB/YeaQ/YmgE family stress response membrane protein [Holophagae bacterium]|nr:MAG: GlsB/YeaQ/YmgE family stress response membrane protein [Holophagae bacterium]
MNVLITIIIGGIIGWLASLIMKTNAQMGILANIVVGIIGSFLGYWLAGLIGIAATTGVARWVVAVVGAVILIAILKAFKIFK